MHPPLHHASEEALPRPWTYRRQGCTFPRTHALRLFGMRVALNVRRLLCEVCYSMHMLFQLSTSVTGA